MGRIKTKDIKKASFSLMDGHPGLFSDNFEKNKKVMEELGIKADKKVRNKISGYIAHVLGRAS